MWSTRNTKDTVFFTKDSKKTTGLGKRLRQLISPNETVLTEGSKTIRSRISKGGRSVLKRLGLITWPFKKLAEYVTDPIKNKILDTLDIPNTTVTLEKVRVPIYQEDKSCIAMPKTWQQQFRLLKQRENNRDRYYLQNTGTGIQHYLNPVGIGNEQEKVIRNNATLYYVVPQTDEKTLAPEDKKNVYTMFINSNGRFSEVSGEFIEKQPIMSERSNAKQIPLHASIFNPRTLKRVWAVTPLTWSLKVVGIAVTIAFCVPLTVLYGLSSVCSRGITALQNSKLNIKGHATKGDKAKNIGIFLLNIPLSIFTSIFCVLRFTARGTIGILSGMYATCDKLAGLAMGYNNPVPMNTTVQIFKDTGKEFVRGMKEIGNNIMSSTKNLKTSLSIESPDSISTSTKCMESDRSSYLISHSLEPTKSNTVWQNSAIAIARDLIKQGDIPKKTDRQSSLSLPYVPNTSLSIINYDRSNTVLPTTLAIVPNATNNQLAR